uniref:Uncharacterized protein n=1 Tax=Apteryx owenii TaxID=8824 RepID=A0A8B9QML9_APTOW
LLLLHLQHAKGHSSPSFSCTLTSPWVPGRFIESHQSPEEVALQRWGLVKQLPRVWILSSTSCPMDGADPLLIVQH